MIRRDSLPNAGSFSNTRRSSIPIDVSSFLSPIFSPTQYLNVTLNPTTTENIPSISQPLINNEILMAVHRSLSITRDKVHNELQRTAINNAELLVECDTLQVEMEKELEKISKQMEQLHTFNEIQQEEKSLFDEESQMEVYDIPEEQSPGPQNDQQLEELINALSGVNLSLIDSSKSQLIKQGQMDELYGSIGSLHTRPVHVIVLNDAVLICNIKEATPSSPTKKKFFSSSKKTLDQVVKEKMTVDKYLPFSTTTLFDIADSQYVQSCIKLKSVDSAELGTKGESVLLSVGVDKEEWMTVLKEVIDAFRAGLKNKSKIPERDHAKKTTIGRQEREREKMQNISHIRDIINQLLSELSNATQLCAYEVALEHIDKLNYQFSKNENIMDLSEYKHRMEQGMEELMEYMLAEIKKPVISKHALQSCIKNLTLLKKTELARNAFLRAKSEMMRLKISSQTCIGDPVRSIDTLCRVYIDLVGEVVTLYRELFNDVNMLSELVLWVRIELISTLKIVHRQLPLVENVDNVKMNVRSKIAALQDIGIDLLPIVDNFFDTQQSK